MSSSYFLPKQAQAQPYIINLSQPILIGIAFVATISLFKIILKFFKKDARHLKFMSAFPSIPHIPFIAPTAFIGLKPEELLPLFNRWILEHGRIICGWILNQPYVLIFKAEDVEKILSSSAFINRSDDYDVMIPWAGQSIVTINGQEWHDRKKVIHPAFHAKNFESFIQIFNEQSAILIKQLSGECGNTCGFDMIPYTKRCALDMICESGLGTSVNAQMNHESEFLEAAEKIGKLISERWLKPYLRINWLWKLTSNGFQQRECLKVLHRFTRNAVTARIEARSASKIRTNRAAFLDIILDMNENGTANFPMQTILDESNIFINAGHETTAMSLAWALFLLGENQECQERVHEELDKVFEYGDEDGASITVEQLSKLKYLDCCIKETYRLCAPVPILARKLGQDCELNNGTVIPSGAVTLISIYHVQRDPEYFPDPDAFKPERFLQDMSKMHPYAFIPFSAGPRNCIGKKFGEFEVKIVLAHVLRAYHVTAMSKFKDTKPYPAAVLFPSTSLSVRIRKR